LLWRTRREEKRWTAGQTYKPPVFLERRNWVGARQLVSTTRRKALPQRTQRSHRVHREEKTAP
jgi:hypothetical protein